MGGLGVLAIGGVATMAGLVGQQGGVFGEFVVGGQLFQRRVGEGQGQVACERFGLGEHVAQGALQDALGEGVVVEQQVEQRAFGDVFALADDEAVVLQALEVGVQAGL